MERRSLVATPLVVAGMHRCGTSLVASLLEAAGIDMGSRLMAANFANPRGYYENLDFVEFHQDILRAEGEDEAGWSRARSEALDEAAVARARALIERNRKEGLWGWKDPRTTLFIDFWAALLPGARFILPYRAPWAVVDSLFRRSDGAFIARPELAAESTLDYFTRMLGSVIRYPNRTLLVNADAVVRDPSRLFRELEVRFGLEPRPVPNAIAHPDELRSADLDDRAALIEIEMPALANVFRQLEGLAAIAGRQEAPTRSKGAFLAWQRSRRRERRLFLTSHATGLGSFLTIGKDALTIDCAGSLELEPIARTARTFTAAERGPDSPARDDSDTYDLDGVRRVAYDGTSLPLPDASLDLAFLNDSERPLFEQRALLADIGRVLRPEGVLVFLGAIESDDTRSSGDLIQMLRRTFSHVDVYAQTFANVSLLHSVERDREFALSSYTMNGSDVGRGLTYGDDRGRVVAICSRQCVPSSVTSIMVERPDNIS